MERQKDRQVYHRGRGKGRRASRRRLSWVVSDQQRPARPTQHGLWHQRGPGRSCTHVHQGKTREAGGPGVGLGMPSPLLSLGPGRASSAPSTRPLQPQRGSVCESKDSGPMQSSVPLVRGPQRGAEGDFALCGGERWAFAETQRHLVAGGAHTRFLSDCLPHHRDCSQAFEGSFMLGSQALEAVIQGFYHLDSTWAPDSGIPAAPAEVGPANR